MSYRYMKCEHRRLRACKKRYSSPYKDMLTKRWMFKCDREDARSF